MISSSKCNKLLQLNFAKFVRFLTPSVEIKNDTISKLDFDWENALPYNKIPGPSKISLLSGFLPRGKFYEKSITEVHKYFNAQYGNIFKVPGSFGKRDLVVIFDTKDFEKVYRTEGLQPIRKGLETIAYYRLVRRAEQFKGAEGLTAVHGEPWANFRTTVNPVMMQPRTIKMYTPKMNSVSDELVKRIKNIRDPKTLEMPGTFIQDINRWTLESVCVVALDAKMYLINNIESNPDAQRLIDAMSTFFDLICKLDVKPSIWKICKTPTFYKMMDAFDVVTEVSTKYIDEALKKLENSEDSDKRDSEKSVLERLLKINKKIAITMAMDLILAGVDTTASAFTSCLLCIAKNPDKQNKLRAELLTILPTKDSPITKDVLLKMPYLRACIRESLRMFPVTIGNFRTTGQDIALSGFQIPKDTDILMSNSILNRDNSFFPNANDFVPERWLRATSDGCPNQNKLTNAFAYLPFGFGPRACVGKRIVNLELKVGLAKIVRNFHIEYNYPEHNVFKTNVINVPGAELKFKFEDVKF